MQTDSIKSKQLGASRPVSTKKSKSKEVKKEGTDEAKKNDSTKRGGDPAVKVNLSKAKKTPDVRTPEQEKDQLVNFYAKRLAREAKKIDAQSKTDTTDTSSTKVKEKAAKEPQKTAVSGNNPDTKRTPQS